jgi:diguanylate cyclase (GGDEF)-like protein
VTSKARITILRHRVTILDAALITTVIAIAGFIAFEFDFAGNVDEDKRIELQEAVTLGIIIMLAIFYFGWRRMAEQEQEITRRIAAERRAHELAHTDPLTGLANRRQFEHALQATIASPPGADSVHAVLMLDLNGFKKVNDIYGHSAGDDVLVVVSQRLAGVMREGDVLARLGGDEFAVIARHLAGPESATGIALRVMKSLEAPIEIKSKLCRMAVGIGIALVPTDGNSSGEIIRRADAALYRAKTEKQSAVRFFEESIDRLTRERELLERELALAIGTDALCPWYQPIVDLRTQEVIAFEALARWSHPTLGNIPPDRFIPMAEDCGLIRELSVHLLRRACRDAREWPDGVLLSFNISPAELKDRTLGLRILSILGESGLSPHRLELEITESALVRDLETAKEVLGSLREAGVRIALDDFGTGYSNLYHLRNFKLDKIKVDRSFVEGMNIENESAAIVRALIGLGSGLGLTVTAEGIEHAAQRDALVEQGCQQGQGFLFSRAVPADEALALLSQSYKQIKYGVDS